MCKICAEIHQQEPTKMQKCYIYLEDPGILNAHYNSLAGHLVRNKTGPIPAAQAGSILLCRFFWCLGVRVTQTTTPNL